MNLVSVKNAILARGLIGFGGVILEKYLKSRRYAKMLREVPLSHGIAVLPGVDRRAIPEDDSADAIRNKADAMLRGENYFFTFPYSLDIDRPWNFDPIEKKHWPERHYTESQLHAVDTPKDVKIVWEINRFKDLPALAQAACITNERRFADEVQKRLHSWIDDNPFANSVNWASGLEIGVRLIAWTAALRLLRHAGFDITDDTIGRSIYEQAAYLRADLSTDRVVRTNHLIGEAAGLFIAASTWQFDGADECRSAALRILEKEVIDQTYLDGSTRESSTWYHQFIADFFDAAYRTSPASFSPQFVARLANIKGFLEAATQPDGTIARLGDNDDGYAVYFEGEQRIWKDLAFGPDTIEPAKFMSEINAFVTQRVGRSYLIMRAVEFGMGGAGFSSHAHDDLLSPILWLESLPILCDPGTYVYNGAPIERAKFRTSEAHNGVLIGLSPAKQKLNFGWHQIRQPVRIKQQFSARGQYPFTASYGEWPHHVRRIDIHEKICIIEDILDREIETKAYLHLHPSWTPDRSRSGAFQNSSSAFLNPGGDRLMIELDNWEAAQPVFYDFSPSYLVKVPAVMLKLHNRGQSGKFAVRMTVRRGDSQEAPERTAN